MLGSKRGRTEWSLLGEGSRWQREQLCPVGGTDEAALQCVACAAVIK